MISFRYHLVSIVAVLVALALGILIGGTLLNSGFESVLKRQVATLGRSVDSLRGKTLALQDDLRVATSYAKETQLQLLAGRLTGQQVVIVTENALDPSEIAAARIALKDLAGASIQGVVILNPKMALQTADAASQLASILGVGGSPTAAQLMGEGATALARRLIDGSPSAGTDPLTALQAGGFVTINEPPKAGIAAVGGPGQSAIVLSGGGNAPAFDPAAFFAPFLQQYVDSGRAAGAAEMQATPHPFLAVLRGDGGLQGKIVTVDDVDQVFGQSALVLGLQELIRTPGHGGDYGVKCGDCSVVPAA